MTPVVNERSLALMVPGRHRADSPAIETCPVCGGAVLGCLCPVNEFPARHKGPPPDHAD